MKARRWSRFLAAALFALGVLAIGASTVRLYATSLAALCAKDLDELERLHAQLLVDARDLLAGLLYFAAAAIVWLLADIANSLDRFAGSRPERKPAEPTGQTKPGAGADRPA